MVIRPKHVAVTELNIQNSVALDGNPEPDTSSTLSLPEHFKASNLIPNTYFVK
jgi:hypothetical protein